MDYIIIFDEITAVEIVKNLKPNIFMKGGDYINKQILESEFSNETKFSPYLEGTSTTLQVKTTIFQFYCKYSHYGDSIFNLRFFYNIRNYLKSNNIKIIYFYCPIYIKNINELEKYIDTMTLTLLPTTEPMNNPIDLWMGYDINNINHHNFIEYVYEYYLNISKILGIILDPIYLNIFQPEFYLKTIYDNFDSKFKDVDFLILNSEPISLQFKYVKDDFDNFCIKLHKMSFKIVTTTYVNDYIPCTFNNGLTIQDIGAISTRAKYIIAVLSGPMTPCFNLLTIKNVHTIFLLCNIKFNFNHSKIKTYDTIDKLDQLISKDF